MKQGKSLERYIPESANQPYDMRAVIEGICDDGFIF